MQCIKKHRESVGPDFPLMIDCYMSLTVPYAIALAKNIEPYKIKWIEEFLPPDDYDGYAQVKKGKGACVCVGSDGCSALADPDVCGVGMRRQRRGLVSVDHG
jgi:L-alanine-DL-glutamate epimerase-like enolase superfamily enzyme